MELNVRTRVHREPWNKGKIVGQKAPLRLKDIWAIRIRLQLAERIRVTFRHAWKNGKWNCLQPVSFDLVDGDAIRQKALRWVGQMAALGGSSEPFKLYMLVGEPKHASVQNQYAKALRILVEKMPVDSAIYTEAQASELSDLVAREIQEHH